MVWWCMMYVKDTFTRFLDKIKRHQLRQPLKAALAVVPSLAFAVRPRQPQKHVVPALGVGTKEKVRRTTIKQFLHYLTSAHPQFSRNAERQNEPGRLAHPSWNIDKQMNGTVRRIRYQCWHFMILVDNPWRSPMSASHLNFWKLLFQHLHLMASACKKLQNMQAWNHYKSLLQQLGTRTDKLQKSIVKSS